MSDIKATNFLRILAVSMLTALIASSFDLYADQDQKCVNDCRQNGYSWSFCDSKCSYNNDSQPQSNLGAILNQQSGPTGMVSGWMRGMEEGQRQRLIQEQIENQRLQNEILRRQLDGYGTPRPPQPAAAPQYDQKAKANEYLEQGNAAYARKNYSDAVLLFGKAAEFGNAIAQTKLGLMYAQGDGIPKDSVKAVEWFRKAAAQGQAVAINNLGTMYDNGDGVAQSHIQALDLYRVAAERGSAQAQANLGKAYEMGLGVPKNYNAALAWYKKATNAGHELSKQRVAAIEKTLNQQIQPPQTNVATEMVARSQARNEGCEISSVDNVQPPTGFNFAYEISCSDSSIRKYKCNSSDCNLVSVVPPMGFQTKSRPKWLNP